MTELEDRKQLEDSLIELVTKTAADWDVYQVTGKAPDGMLTFTALVHKILETKDIKRGLELLALERDGKLVLLDEDQSLPSEIDRFKGQVKRVLAQAGFKRVEPLPPTEETG